MKAETKNLIQRYERTLSGLLKAISAHKHMLPLWLAPVYEKLYWLTHARVLVVFSRLFAGTYRLPRKRTTPRPSRANQPAKPPSFPLLPKAWKWLTRALPSPVCEAVRAHAAELQQLLSEPAAIELLAIAPTLRHHLRPLCRALGVTLPGETPPPDPGPEPPPPPPEPRPLPPIGDVVHRREAGPLPRRVDLGPSYRSQKNWLWPVMPSHVHFVAIS